MIVSGPKHKKRPAMISPDVLAELVAAKLRASDLAKACTEAISAQADKHGIDKKALSAAVKALAKTKSDEAVARAMALVGILGGG